MHNFWGELTVAAILKHFLPDPKEQMVPTDWIKNMDFTLPCLCVPISGLT